MAIEVLFMNFWSYHFNYVYHNWDAYKRSEISLGNQIIGFIHKKEYRKHVSVKQTLSSTAIKKIVQKFQAQVS